MIRIAVVEDNKSDYEVLYELLLRYGLEKEVNFDIKYFSDAVGFVSDYRYEFDIIFLDIMMPDLGGMNAAKKIRQVDGNVVIIFVTNMPQYAIEGYSVNAFYYLLKPPAYSDFSVKMDNVLNYIFRELRGDFLFVKPSFEERKVFIKDIKYIEIFAHDVIFHTFDEDIHVRGTLSEYEKKLNPEKFCRINSCYLVNLDYVTVVKDMSVFINQTELKISYSRKKHFMKTLAQYAGRGCNS